MWPWRVKMPTQNFLRLLLLLMLIDEERIVLVTVCCRFGSWGFVIKLKIFQNLSTRFGQYFEVKVRARFDAGKNYTFGTYFTRLPVATNLNSVLKLSLVDISNFKFSREADVCSRFWCCCLVDILKMRFDQVLCLNLWFALISYFGKLNSTLGSVVPLAMFEESSEGDYLLILFM